MKGKLVYYDHGNYTVILTANGKIEVGYDNNYRLDRVIVYNLKEVQQKREYNYNRDLSKKEVKSMIKIAFDNPYQIPKFIKDKIYQVLTDLVNNGFRFTFDHLYCFDFTD